MNAKEAAELIRKNWDKADGCRSCGWKSLAYEHEPIEACIEQEDIDKGEVRFPCFSDDASENGGHKGITVYLREPSGSTNG